MLVLLVVFLSLQVLTPADVAALMLRLGVSRNLVAKTWPDFFPHVFYRIWMNCQTVVGRHFSNRFPINFFEICFFIYFLLLFWISKQLLTTTFCLFPLFSSAICAPYLRPSTYASSAARLWAVESLILRISFWNFDSVFLKC